MARKGLFVLFGAPGAGKSTEAAETFQDSISIVSSPNVQQFYDMKLESSPESGLKPPKRRIVVDVYSVDGKPNLDADGMPMPISTQATILGIFDQVIRKAFTEYTAGEPLTYRNVIIDEIGTFWSRIFEEILPMCVTKSGAIDTRAAYVQMASWSTKVVDKVRQVTTAGLNVAVVAHDKEPDQAHQKKGGPKFVSESIMRQICADADGVLMRALEDREIGSPAARVWRVHASQHWLSKIRGVPDNMYAEIADWPLHKIVKLAGYEP